MHIVEMPIRHARYQPSAALRFPYLVVYSVSMSSNLADVFTCLAESLSVSEPNPCRGLRLVFNWLASCSGAMAG